MADSGLNRGSRSWPTFLAAADTPVSQLNASDHARTMGVSGQLAAMLFAAMSRRKRAAPLTAWARRFGLLGGLGQGKSSALNQALRTLNELLKSEGQRGANVAYFDAAHEKPDDLEFAFDRLQASLSLGRMVLRALLRVLLLALLLSSVLLALLFTFAALGVNVFDPRLAALVPGWDKTLLAALATVSPVALVKDVWPFAKRRWGRRFNFNLQPDKRPWLRSLQEFGSFLVAAVRRVDVLVVDNLDRANTVQQRALLRALYKHQGDVSCLVVVVFDEGGLLRQGSHDPEAPEQLLAKAIEVSLRVPDRLPAESLALAQLAVGALPQPEWREATLQHEVVLALAEAVQALGVMSPRMSKRLLNDACALLDQLPGDLRAESASARTGLLAEPLHQRVREWLPALLRLQVLWRRGAALREWPLELAAALGAHTHSDRARLLALLPQGDAQVLAQPLADAPHIRPLRGEWRGLIAAMHTGYWRSTGANSQPSEPWPDVSFQILDSAWKAIDDFGELDNRLEVNLSADEWATVRLHLPRLVHALLVLWTATPVGQQRAVKKLERLLWLVKEHRLSWLPEAAAPEFSRSVCRLLVRRAGDACTAADILRWLELVGPTSAMWRWNALLLRPAKGLTWVDVWRLVGSAEDVGTAAPELEPRAQQLWAAELETPLHFASKELAAEMLEVSRRAASARQALLAAWPSHSEQSTGASRTEKVGEWQMLRAVLMPIASSAVTLPAPLVHALRSGRCDVACLRALWESPGYEGLDFWSSGLCQTVLQVVPEAFDAAAWTRWATAQPADAETRAALLLTLACAGPEAMTSHWQLLAAPVSVWPAGERWRKLLFATMHDGLGTLGGTKKLDAWANYWRRHRPMFEWLTAKVLAGHFDHRVFQSERRAFRALRKMLRGQDPK